MHGFSLVFPSRTPADPGTAFRSDERRWYAVFTAPRNEKSVVRHLDLREIECFLPTYETLRLWKNRPECCRSSATGVARCHCPIRR